MAAQKCKIILFQAALKDFWSSANLKLKILSLSNSHFLWIIFYTNKCKNGGSWELLLFVSDLNIVPQWVFKKNLTFEGLQT